MYLQSSFFINNNSKLETTQKTISKRMDLKKQ